MKRFIKITQKTKESIIDIFERLKVTEMDNEKDLQNSQKPSNAKSEKPNPKVDLPNLARIHHFNASRKA